MCVLYVSFGSKVRWRLFEWRSLHGRPGCQLDATEQLHFLVYISLYTVTVELTINVYSCIYLLCQL